MLFFSRLLTLKVAKNYTYTESFECGEGPVQFALHLHLEGKFGGANIPFAGFASPEADIGKGEGIFQN